MPTVVATELVRANRYSEMDTCRLCGCPLFTITSRCTVGERLGCLFPQRHRFSIGSLSEMAVRWGISKATTERVSKKLTDMDYISLMSFPRRTAGGGAQKLGYDIMTLEGFDSKMTHMIVFDAPSVESSIGDKGDTNAAISDRNRM